MSLLKREFTSLHPREGKAARTNIDNARKTIMPLH